MHQLIEKFLHEVGIGCGPSSSTLATGVELAKDGNVAHGGASIIATHTIEDSLGLRIAATDLLHDAIDGTVATVETEHDVLEERDENGCLLSRTENSGE